MVLELLVVALKGLVAAAALISAVFWILSARVEVTIPDDDHKFTFRIFSRGRTIDWIATLQKQGRLNRHAAAWSGITAGAAFVLQLVDALKL